MIGHTRNVGDHWQSSDRVDSPQKVELVSSPTWDYIQISLLNHNGDMNPWVTEALVAKILVNRGFLPHIHNKPCLMFVFLEKTKIIHPYPYHKPLNSSPRKWKLNDTWIDVQRAHNPKITKIIGSVTRTQGTKTVLSLVHCLQTSVYDRGTT